MAKCSKCGDQIRWAVIGNGKLAGKNRPFDFEGKTDGGKYGLAGSGEFDQYDNEKLVATFYDDPVEGLEKHEVLYENHFDTCKANAYKPGNSQPASGGLTVSVMVGNIKYSGRVYPEAQDKFGKSEDGPGL